MRGHTAYGACLAVAAVAAAPGVPLVYRAALSSLCRRVAEVCHHDAAAVVAYGELFAFVNACSRSSWPMA